MERLGVLNGAIERIEDPSYGYDGMPILLHRAQQTASQHASGDRGAYLLLPVSILELGIREGVFFSQYTVSYTLDFGQGPETTTVPLRSSRMLWLHYQGFLLGRKSR
ncbi:hypothetical protein C5B96_08540 [Subtercola sp. Z020]|uniref:hypothetical protein n=1 Tax=Subtercola sp. Z020 TaxID=2080582 RepID=UPI000CE8E682|nr:hypothetical protein [Subtercola sp. Z020]PPF82974.1 hypothetical protein C5B96_08540 [Subtercola sp. Z020]